MSNAVGAPVETDRSPAEGGGTAAIDPMKVKVVKRLHYLSFVQDLARRDIQRCIDTVGIENLSSRVGAQKAASLQRKSPSKQQPSKPTTPPPYNFSYTAPPPRPLPPPSDSVIPPPAKRPAAPRSVKKQQPTAKPDPLPAAPVAAAPAVPSSELREMKAMILALREELQKGKQPPAPVGRPTVQPLLSVEPKTKSDLATPPPPPPLVPSPETPETPQEIDQRKSDLHEEIIRRVVKMAKEKMAVVPSPTAGGKKTPQASTPAKTSTPKRPPYARPLVEAEIQAESLAGQQQQVGTSPLIAKPHNASVQAVMSPYKTNETRETPNMTNACTSPMYPPLKKVHLEEDLYPPPVFEAGPRDIDSLLADLDRIQTGQDEIYARMVKDSEIVIRMTHQMGGGGNAEEEPTEKVLAVMQDVPLAPPPSFAPRRPRGRVPPEAVEAIHKYREDRASYKAVCEDVLRCSWGDQVEVSRKLTRSVQASLEAEIEEEVAAFCDVFVEDIIGKELST